jgi:hypothetical protein
MLNRIHLLLYLEIALFLVFQLALLLIQGAALRRHGQRGFQLLFSSTVCGIGLLVANTSVQVFAATGDWIFRLYLLGFCFGVAQTVFAWAGFVFLFRDYRRLAEHFDKTSDTHNASDSNA